MKKSLSFLVSLRGAYGPGRRWGGLQFPLPKFSSPPFFGGNKIKLGRRQFLKTFSCFFYYYYFIIFYVFKLLTWSRRNISVTSTRGSGWLARDEFLVIREGYQMLISIFVFFLILFGTALAGMGYFRSWIDYNKLPHNFLESSQLVEHCMTDNISKGAENEEVATTSV